MMFGWAVTIAVVVLNGVAVLDSHQGVWNVVRVVATVIWVSAAAAFLVAIYRRGH
jgi:hypothetical protein